MTVVLGVVCDDGLVMAADTQITESDRAMTERSVDYGVVAALRVLEALSYTSPSVGGPFTLVRITSDGAHALEDGEIEGARRHVERWRELEQDALDRLFD